MQNQFIINTQPAIYLSLMVTALEKSCFVLTRNQVQEMLSKPMRKMTATHISMNTRTGKNLPLSKSNFNDSSWNNSISKAHTSGSNVVLQLKPSSANSSQTQLLPASLSSVGKEFLQHSLKSDQVLTGPHLRQGGSSYLMELLVQQTLLHWFTPSLCFQTYPCKHKDKEHDCSHMLQ